MSAPDPLEEQEIDLASWWERIKLRWWLPVGGLVVGAVLGIALAVSGGTVWRAEAIVYLGQPFAPNGGGQITSLATNPRTVNEIVHSESAIDAAANASGMSRSALRSSVSTADLTAPGQVKGVNPLVEIGVKASGRRKAEDAANTLANRVVSRVSVFVTEKVALLGRQIQVSEDQLAAVTARINRAQTQLQDLSTGSSSLSPELKVILGLNLNTVIVTADARRTSLQDQLYSANQLLNLAESVEKSRIVEPAKAHKSSARSSRSSLLVGAVIGLLLGAIAALLADSVTARRREGTSAPSA